ncbi:MAG: hypothetical protein [Microviridae sp.]|nr:MAG: hypothetical protein [Microviridae sp.]
MKKRKIHITDVAGVPTYEGETIEEKVSRIVDNKEPITDGAPIVYTEKKNGVIPAYDVRTDRWEIALNAMAAVNATKIAKSREYLKKEEEPRRDTTKTDVSVN